MRRQHLLVVFQCLLLLGCNTFARNVPPGFLPMSAAGNAISIDRVNIANRILPSTVPNESWTCGLHALALVYSALNERPADGHALFAQARRAMTLRRAVPIGLPPGELRHMASAQQIPTEIHYDATAAKLESMLARGHLAIALVENGYRRTIVGTKSINLHYLLLTGMAQNERGEKFFIVIPDGARPTSALLPYAEMDRRLAWSAHGLSKLSLFASGLRSHTALEILNSETDHDRFVLFSCTANRCKARL